MQIGKGRKGWYLKVGHVVYGPYKKRTIAKRLALDLEKENEGNMV